MNLTDKQKQWIAWGISTIVVLALSLTLGIKYPLPEPPVDLPDQIIALTEAPAATLSTAQPLTLTVTQGQVWLVQIDAQTPNTITVSYTQIK